MLEMRLAGDFYNMTASQLPLKHSSDALLADVGSETYGGLLGRRMFHEGCNWQRTQWPCLGSCAQNAQVFARQKPARRIRACSTRHFQALGSSQVQLNHGKRLHASAGEEASFRLDRMPFDFDHKSGSVVQKVTLQIWRWLQLKSHLWYGRSRIFPSFLFPHTSRQLRKCLDSAFSQFRLRHYAGEEPPGGCLNTCVELRNVHAREAGTRRMPHRIPQKARRLMGVASFRITCRMKCSGSVMMVFMSFRGSKVQGFKAPRLQGSKASFGIHTWRPSLAPSTFSRRRWAVGNGRANTLLTPLSPGISILLQWQSQRAEIGHEGRSRCSLALASHLFHLLVTVMTCHQAHSKPRARDGAGASMRAAAMHALYRSGIDGDTNFERLTECRVSAASPTR